MMKKYLFSLLFALFCLCMYGQMNYQAIVFDDFGEPLSSTTVSVRSSIHLNSPNGTVSYQETQAVDTDDFGRLNLVLGDGNATIGSYASIPRTGLHFLEIEVDVDGGANYTSLSTIEIQSAFKADEIDPVFDASPAGGITNADIANWNNPTGGGGVVIAINNGNYQSEVINDYNMVNIQEAIALSSSFFGFDRTRLFISGGAISSSNMNTIDFGSYTTISNVDFTNVEISGFKLTFINCTFNGNIELPDECNILGGKFLNCIATTSAVNNWILSIVGAHIDESTITRVKSISNAYIEDSTVGETTSTNAGNIQNCYIQDSQFLNPVMFANNDCSDTYVELRNEINFAVIEGNNFDGLYSGQNKILEINRQSSSADHVVRVSDNHFWSASGDYSIIVNGTYSNSTFESMVFVDGNSFSRGTAAIDNNSSQVYLFVRNNTSQNMSTGLGVNSSSFNILSDNYNIP